MRKISSFASVIILSGIFVPFFAMAAAGDEAGLEALAVVPASEVPVGMDKAPAATSYTGEDLRTFRANASGQSDVAARLA